MTNEEVNARVKTIAEALLKGVKMRDDDGPVVEAVIDLISNLLTNINDIAEGYTIYTERSKK